MNGIYCEQDYQKCRVGHVPMYRTEWLDMYPCTVLYGWTVDMYPCIVLYGWTCTRVQYYRNCAKHTYRNQHILQTIVLYFLNIFLK